MQRIGTILMRHRGWAAALAALLTVAALVGVAILDFEDRARDLYRRRDDNMRLLDHVLTHFGADDNDMLLVLEADDVFSADTLRRVAKIVEGAEKIPGIGGTASVFDLRRRQLAIPLIPPLDAEEERFAHARELATDHPLVKGRFVSEDFGTMLVVIHLEGGALSATHLKRMDDAVREVVNREAAGSDLTYRITGQPAVRIDSLYTLKVEQARFTLLSGLVSFAIAWALFRRVAAVFVAVASPALGVLWCVGLMSFAGQKIDGINIVLPTLLFVIGFTDVTHLLVDMRRSIAAGLDARQAAFDAVGRLGSACFLTSLTTAIGFGSLAISDTWSIQRFGLSCAAGAGLMYVAAIVVTPLMVSFLPARWLVPTHGSADTAIRRQTVIASLVSPLIRFPRLTVALGAALCCWFAVETWKLESDILWTEAIPAGSETNVAVDQLDRHFGGAVQASVLVTWPEEKELDSAEVLESLAEVHKVLEAEEMLGRPFSVLNVLASMQSERTWKNRVARLEQLPPEGTRRLVRTDLREALVTVPVPNRGERDLQPVYDRIAAELAELETRRPNFRFQLTGTTVVAGRNLDHMISDLQMSLFGAAGVVFAVVLVAFGSWRFGLMTSLPNAFPLLFTSALMVWLNQPLRITGALTYCLCLGLAVDDTIHLLARYLRERAAGGDYRDVVLRSVNSVGNVLIITTLILVGGLGVMFFSAMPAIRNFAGLSVVALLAALVGDLILLPALLLAFPARRTEPEPVASGTEKPLD